MSNTQRWLAGALLATAALLAQAADSPLTGCAAKQQEIRLKLDQARGQQQFHQQAGLEKALKATQAQCSDSALHHSRQRKAEQARQVVRERQADLQEAQRQGDAQKILKGQNKLNKAHQELRQAERQLKR